MFIFRNNSLTKIDHVLQEKYPFIAKERPEKLAWSHRPTGLRCTPIWVWAWSWTEWPWRCTTRRLHRSGSTWTICSARLGSRSPRPASSPCAALAAQRNVRSLVWLSHKRPEWTPSAQNKCPARIWSQSCIFVTRNPTERTHSNFSNII